MRVHSLAKTELSSKQRKKWMRGIQMNVEDAEENGMDFHYYFCGWHFFIRSQDLHYCFLWQLYFFISSWERTRQTPQDEFPQHVSLGWTAFVRSIMYHTRNIYENSLMLWSFSLQKLIRNKSVKIPCFSNYGNFGERRLPMKRTIFFFAVLEASGPSFARIYMCYIPLL